MSPHTMKHLAAAAVVVCLAAGILLWGGAHGTAALYGYGPAPAATPVAVAPVAAAPAASAAAASAPGTATSPNRPTPRVQPVLAPVAGAEQRAMDAPAPLVVTVWMPLGSPVAAVAAAVDAMQSGAVASSELSAAGGRAAPSVSVELIPLGPDALPWKRAAATGTLPDVMVRVCAGKAGRAAADRWAPQIAVIRHLAATAVGGTPAAAALAETGRWRAAVAVARRVQTACAAASSQTQK